MLVSTLLLLLIPFLTVAFLPLGLRAFSPAELEQMGVQLESAETPQHPCDNPTITGSAMFAVLVNKTRLETCKA